MNAEKAEELEELKTQLQAELESCCPLSALTAKEHQALLSHTKLLQTHVDSLHTARITLKHGYKPKIPTKCLTQSISPPLTPTSFFGSMHMPLDLELEPLNSHWTSGDLDVDMDGMHEQLGGGLGIWGVGEYGMQVGSSYFPGTL